MGLDVAYVALDAPTKVERVVSTRFNEWDPALSPDGRWVAYATNETGRNEVIVTDFPSASQRWPASRSGGEVPSWRADGRELYFVGPGGLNASPVFERAGTLDIGVPEVLPIPVEPNRWGNRLRVTSFDGRRFLVLRFLPEEAPEPLRLVRGWRQLLER